MSRASCQKLPHLYKTRWDETKSDHELRRSCFFAFKVYTWPVASVANTSLSKKSLGVMATMNATFHRHCHGILHVEIATGLISTPQLPRMHVLDDGFKKAKYTQRRWLMMVRIKSVQLRNLQRHKLGWYRQSFIQSQVDLRRLSIAWFPI